MEVNDVIENMKAINHKMIADIKESDKKNEAKKDEAPVEFVDVYQRNQQRARDVAQKSYPNGSSAAVNMSVAAVIDGVGAEGLAKAYKRAKDDSASLLSKGERGRAEIRRQQYMQEDFLPAVEIVINSTSPDEVLANQKALEELDKYTFLGGPGKGYTATYIRQAYGNQLGQITGRSDPSVRSGVMQINTLLDNGEVRTAVGIANKLKDKIDKGEAMADDIDFELIGRVVSFFE